jgi:4-amino-4-deoxy-L-arabinose transferase-like glycosyltransferase
MTEPRPSSQTSSHWRWPAWGLLILLLPGLWLLRLFTASHSGAGLFVDEAQYWEWSRELAWGFYSKPPFLSFLIQWSVWVAGDSTTGVRWLVQLCWAVVPLVLWRLGWEMQRDSQQPMASPHAVGAWAAVLFASSLASGVLGQVATTDGPLVLFWSLQLWLVWRAMAQPLRWSRWLWVGAVLALGVLSKYTMSAVLASWVVWWWFGHRSVAVSKGMALAAGLAALALLPHLAWNHAHDWPTLKHTADLLSGGSASSGSFFAKLLPRLLEYLGSQALLAGPVFLLVSMVAVMRLWIKPVSPALNFSTRPALWAWHGSWPLWAIGGLQAMQGTAQINWPAPALLGASVALGWLLASRPAPWRWREPVAVLLMASFFSTALSLGGDWRDRLGLPVQKSKWDLWGRARGWEEALLQFQPLVASHPDATLVALDRTLIIHAAYAWRAQKVMALSWQRTPHPLHHYDLLYRFDPAQHTGPVLLLVMGELPGFVRERYKQVELLSDPAPTGRQLFLWLLKEPQP